MESHAVVRRRALIGLVIAVAFIVLTVWGALWLYGQSTHMFDRAAYLANCAPDAKVHASQATCGALNTAPASLGDIPLNDEPFTIAAGNTFITEGNELVVIGGLATTITLAATGYAVTSAQVKYKDR